MVKIQKYYIIVLYIMSGINVTNLKAKSSGVAKIYNYVWYDISDSVPVTDSDLSKNERYVVANSSGPLNLVHVAGSGDTDYIVSDTINIVNDLFIDQDGDSYYDSYETNYRTHTETSAIYDISTSAIVENEGDDHDHMTLDVTSLANNNLVLHLDQFADDRGTTMTEKYKIVMDTLLDFYPVANVTGISNNLTINLHYFGVDAVPDNTKSFMIGQNGTLDLDVNALTSNAVLKFTSDALANDEEFEAYPKPSILMANMLPRTVALSGAGRTSVSVPVTVPSDGDGLKSGAWNWLMTVVDGDYTSTPVPIKLVVAPTLSNPVISTSSTLAFTHNATKTVTINAKYLPADIENLDIASWDPLMDVSATVHLNDEDKTLLFASGGSANGLSLVERWNNMDSRTLDASANFALTYTDTKYNLLNTNFILRLTWQDDKNGEQHNLDYPFTITGVTHTSQVTVVNDFNGKYTLSGGNKKSSETYVYRTFDSDDTWTRMDSNVYVATSTANIEFAVTDLVSGIVGAGEVFSSTKSGEISVTNSVLTIDISSGPMFGVPTVSDVIPITTINDIVTAQSMETMTTSRLTIGEDSNADIYVNFTKPAWFNEISNGNLTVKIVEEVPEGGYSSLTGFDLSTNVAIKSALSLSSGTYQVISGTDAYEFGSYLSSFAPSINLYFKEERISKTTLIVTATYKGNGVVMSTTSGAFSVASTVINNVGSNYSNVIVPNRSKMNLTRINSTFGPVRLTANETDVSNAFDGVVDISTNTYRQLGTVINGMAYVDLASLNLVNGPIKHLFDVSGFKITTHNDNGNKPKVYFPHDKYSSTVALDDYEDVTAYYSSNYDDIFIDFDYFTGVVDIEYNTVYAEELSSEPNKLRVYVLPRPGVQYATTEPAQNLNRINAPTWLSHTITNSQRNDSGLISWNTDDLPAPLDHGETDILPLLKTYITVTRTSVPTFVDISDNVPDGDHFEVETSVPTILYGETGNGRVKFLGVDIDNDDVSTNPHTLYFESTVHYRTHARYGSIPLTNSSIFKIHVVDDLELSYVDKLVANDIYMSGALAINNIDFVKYIIVDSYVDLTDPIYKNTLQIIVENVHYESINIKFSDSASVEPIGFAQRGFFKRDTPYAWSYVGIVGSSLP